MYFLFLQYTKPVLSISSTVKSSCAFLFLKYSESLQWIKLTQLRAHYSPRESERHLGKFRLRSAVEALDIKENEKKKNRRRRNCEKRTKANNAVLGSPRGRCWFIYKEVEAVSNHRDNA